MDSNNQRRGECPNCRRALFLPHPVSAPSDDSFTDLDDLVAITQPITASVRPPTRRGLSDLFRQDRRERRYPIGFGSFGRFSDLYALYFPEDMIAVAEERSTAIMPPALSIHNVVSAVTDVMQQIPLPADANTDHEHRHSFGLNEAIGTQSGAQVNSDQDCPDSSDLNVTSGLRREALRLGRLGLGLLRHRRNSERLRTQNTSLSSTEIQTVGERVTDTTEQSQDHGFLSAIANLGRRFYDRFTRSDDSIEAAERHARIRAQETVRRVGDDAVSVVIGSRCVGTLSPMRNMFVISIESPSRSSWWTIISALAILGVMSLFVEWGWLVLMVW
jgi:hypothetical protein